MQVHTSTPMTALQIRTQVTAMGIVVAVWIGVTIPFIVEAIAG